jgi:cytidylate kinase
MIIAISGLTGSGKSTIGEEVARELNIKHISTTHKKYALPGEELLKFTKNATPEFERRFDKQIIKEANESDCVVTTWLSPWLIKGATARVWLHASPEVRAVRKKHELKKSLDYIRKYVKDKDTTNARRFRKIYGVDINDHSIFDIIINTDGLNISQVSQLVVSLSAIKEKKIFK